MASAALHPFFQAAERDLALFNVAHFAAAEVRWWLFSLLRVFVFPVFILFAQFVPSIYRRHLALLIPQLPDVNAPGDLSLVKDVLVLYYESLKEYSRFCFFRRRQAEEILAEIDEHLDSLEFITANREFLDKAVTQIEQR